jgi:four helix bundle protein
MESDPRHVAWERQQAELWDRIFQVTQDVVMLVDTLGSSTGSDVVKKELAHCAMSVGSHLVRANASDERREFLHHLHEARMMAIETDYWLRMAYLLQQREELQRDLSNIITQYSAIVDLLQKFTRHSQTEANVIAHHGKGPRVT